MTKRSIETLNDNPETQNNDNIISINRQMLTFRKSKTTIEKRVNHTL